MANLHKTEETPLAVGGGGLLAIGLGGGLGGILCSQTCVACQTLQPDIQISLRTGYHWTLSHSSPNYTDNLFIWTTLWTVVHECIKSKQENIFNTAQVRIIVLLHSCIVNLTAVRHI